jgi:hypothetical protein
VKFVVGNEQEKSLIHRFLRAIRELDLLDDFEAIDMECETSESPMFLSSAEYTLLRDNLHIFTKIEIDTNEKEMSFEDNNIVQGTCVDCSAHTEGFADGRTVTYKDYLEIMNDTENTRCEDCYQKKMQVEGEC